MKLIKNLVVFIAITSITSASYAGSLLEGTWKKTGTLGKDSLTLKVYQTPTGTLSAKIVKNNTAIKKCRRCKGKLKNKSLKNITYLYGLTQVPGKPTHYNKAKLLDYKMGNYRRAEAKIVNSNLFIRDLDGNQSQLWKRVN